MRVPNVKYSEIFENKSRARIYCLLRWKPGLNTNAVAKEVGIDYKVAQHHLQVLDFHGLVFASRKGEKRIFYTRPYHHPNASSILAPYEIAALFPPGDYGTIMPDYRQRKI